MCIPIKDLVARNHPLARTAPWFARTATRLTVEYRVRAEYSFGYLLFDEFWRREPAVEFKVERVGRNARNARINFKADPAATDAELLQAMKLARAELALSRLPSCRQPRQRTVSLATFLANSLAGDLIQPKDVPWGQLMLVWNCLCGNLLPSDWAYTPNGAGSNPAHQFAKEAKNALETIRGEVTPYALRGERKRKLLN
jgi:hypothetical protein